MVFWQDSRVQSLCSGTTIVSWNDKLQSMWLLSLATLFLVSSVNMDSSRHGPIFWRTEAFILIGHNCLLKLLSFFFSLKSLRKFIFYWWHAHKISFGLPHSYLPTTMSLAGTLAVQRTLVSFFIVGENKGCYRGTHRSGAQISRVCNQVLYKQTWV